MIRKFVCCVPECMNTLAENKDLYFHSIPTNEDQKRKWLELIKDPTLKTLTSSTLHNMRICGAHFSPEQYRNTVSSRLNIGAMPTLLLPEYEISTLETNRLESYNVVEVRENCDINTTQKIPGQGSKKNSQDDDYEIMIQGTSPKIVPAASASSENVSDNVPVLPTLGAAYVENLTPKKKQLYAQLKISKKIISTIKRKSNVKSLMTENECIDLFDNKLLKNLNKLEYMPPLVRKFIERELQNIVSKKKNHYTNDEKALFIAIMKYSPKAYKFLGSVFSFPSCKTLKEYLNNICFKPGINNQFFLYLHIKSQSMSPLDKYCVLMFAEVSLAKNLYYNTRERLVNGVINVGTGKQSKIDNHALVFMLRGLHKKWKQPVAFYFVKNAVKTSRLKTCIQEVVNAVHERTELRILASVSDSTTSSCRVIACLSDDYAVHGGQGDFVYNVGSQKIIHIFDVPYLMKCIRNNFLNNDVIHEGKRAKWSDVRQLYEYHASIPHGNATKLSLHHVQPNNRMKMRVKYAVELFSLSTYTVLQLLSIGGAMQASDTANFIFFMNDLFDSLNCVHKSTRPLASKLCDNSAHQAFWEKAKKTIKELKFLHNGQLVKEEAPSLKYVNYTITNIQTLWKDMKRIGFKYLHTKNLNQDPLENFLGVMRSLCSSSTHLTCSQFVSAFKTSIVNNTLKHSSASNSEDDGCEFLLVLNTLLTPKPANIPTIINPRTPRTKPISLTISQTTSLSIVPQNQESRDLHTPS